MTAIRVSGLTKYYRVHQRQAGLLAAIKSL